MTFINPHLVRLPSPRPDMNSLKRQGDAPYEVTTNSSPQKKHCHTEHNSFSSYFAGAPNHTAEQEKPKRPDNKIELELQAKTKFVEIGKKFGADAARQLEQHSNTIKEVLTHLLRSDSHKYRVGCIYARQNPAKGTIEIFILDENRSYIPNQTIGGFKLVKTKNFFFSLSKALCTDLIKSSIIQVINHISIQQFVSLSRKNTQGITKEKAIDPNNTAFTLKSNVRELSEETITKDGFKKLSLLDSKGKPKEIFVAPYLGESLIDSIYFKELITKSKKHFFTAIREIFKLVMHVNFVQKTPIYDLKLDNILFTNKNEFNLIDFRVPNALTPDYVLKETFSDLIKYQTENKLSAEDTLKHFQEKLLWENMITSFLCLAAVYLPEMTFNEIYSTLADESFLNEIPISRERKQVFKLHLRNHRSEYRDYFDDEREKAFN